MLEKMLLNFKNLYIKIPAPLVVVLLLTLVAHEFESV